MGIFLFCRLTEDRSSAYQIPLLKGDTSTPTKNLTSFDASVGRYSSMADFQSDTDEHVSDSEKASTRKESAREQQL